MPSILLNKKISAITNEVETQTEKMPMIAIEDHHIDCLHGPFIVSPLDIAIYEQGKSLDIKPQVNQSSQTDSEFLEEKRESKEIQTYFTSFTNPTHYHYPSDSFKRYLILDSSKNLPRNEIKKNAKAFNIDFFRKNIDLFSFKFITKYFFSHFQRSKL